MNYLHSDYLGSLRVITNASGTMDWSRDFYPFGEEINASGTGNEYKFTGKEWDEESGLYYSWHRYYSPLLGRFTQVDPLWVKYPGLTSYHYCMNNPLTVIDPDGMEVQGSEKDLEEESKKINQGLKKQGITNASVSVQSKTQQKTGISKLIAKLFGGSTTETVYFLQPEGKGWEQMKNGELIAKGNPVAKASPQEITGALNDLYDILTMSKIMNLSIQDQCVYRGDDINVDKSWGGGRNFGNYNVVLSNSSNFGTFMHEFIGHTHPNWSNKQAVRLNMIFENENRTPHGGQLWEYKQLKIK